MNAHKFNKKYICSNTCYAHRYIKKAEQLIKSMGVNENLANEKKCFSDVCIIYTFKSSNFEAGIPKLILKKLVKKR